MDSQQLRPVTSSKPMDLFLEARRAMESDNPSAAQKLMEKSLKAANKQGNYDLRVRAIFALISLSGHVFPFDEARKHRLRLSARLFSLAKARGDIVTMVRAKGEYAIAQPNPVASAIIMRAAEIARNDETGRASAYLAIHGAGVAALGGRKSEANLLCNCALAMKDKLFPLEIPSLLELLATTLEDSRESAKLYEKSIDLRRELGQKASFVLAVLFYLGFLSKSAARTKGRDLLREAYEVAKEIDSSRLIAHCEASERYLEVASRRLRFRPKVSGSPARRRSLSHHREER